MEEILLLNNFSRLLIHALVVETAVRLVSKFSKHDAETVLIIFEKIAELSNFPPDKYAAILHAHLTGKALKAFTELSVEECRDYTTMKAALLQAYSAVPEDYRKRFRNLTKRLRVRFLSRHSIHSLVRERECLLRDMIQREQFQSNLDPELRVWLIDLQELVQGC